MSMDLYVSVEEAKRHLNIDEMITQDDEIIEAICEAAQDAVETHLNRPLTDLEVQPGKLRPAINHALKLMIGNLYSNREASGPVKMVEVPYTVSFLLDPHRKLV